MSANTAEIFARGIESAMNDAEFDCYREFLLREAGLRLNGSKRALLVGRLSRRLRETGCASYGDYLQLATRDADERLRLLDQVATNETSFFREPTQFEFLEQSIIPDWRRRADAGERTCAVRVWSAGCATGEEPYSLAMLLKAQLAEWRIEIVASDLSTRALGAAQAGVWPIAKAAGIPEPFRHRYMLRGIGAQAGRLAASRELKRCIAFLRLNLIEPLDSVGGPFDLILCRNVMMYFGDDARRRVVAGLVDRLPLGGHLLVGHAETLHGLDSRVVAVRPTIWMRHS